uniref:Restriction endonuclease n=1 Tax=Candidatus Kentrum sp. FW TaxID=2126338 RepID=A0A450SYV9_9GAMM|nr:MAG: Putative restriction endonuclease [Candidatus Kentron sp. FW]VFJ59229.1 MAG: Putative restriction endonuclease [Candidatus Kentron sp. FW]
MTKNSRCLSFRVGWLENYKKVTMSPSYNHSYLAYRVAKALDQGEKYNIHIEVTLEFDGANYVPDIALYGKRPIDFLHDEISSKAPPPLLVEILSFHQSVNEITDKFKIYLQAGVKSCWLVIPPTKTIVLFHDLQHPRSYSMGKFTDSNMGIEVSVDDIFG